MMIRSYEYRAYRQVFSFIKRQMGTETEHVEKGPERHCPASITVVFPTATSICSSWFVHYADIHRGWQVWIPVHVSPNMSHTEGKDLISRVGGAKIFFNNKTADADNHIQSKRNILFSTLNMKRCLIAWKEMELQGQTFLFLKSSESQVIGLIIFWC